MATIATLNVSLKASTKKFRKSLRNASRIVGKFSRKVLRASLNIAKMGLALAVITAGALVFYIKKTLEAIDATGKLADRIGIATEDLQGLRLAAEINGVSIDSLDKSLEKMTKNLGEATQNLGTAKDGLKKLGIPLEDIINLNPTEQFKKIADGIAGLSTQAEKAAVANQFFGRTGVKLINVLDQGSKAIDGFIKEADEIGFSFNRIDAKNVEDANDAFTRLGTRIQGVINKITIKLAPVLEKIAIKLADMIPKGKKIDEVLSSFANNFADGLGKVFRAGRIVVSIMGLISAAAQKAIGFVSSIVQDLLERAELISNFITNPEKTEDTANFGARRLAKATEDLNKRSIEALRKALSDFDKAMARETATKFADKIKGLFEKITGAFKKDLSDAIPDEVKSEDIRKKIGQFREINLKNIQVGGLRVLQDPQLKEQKKGNDLLAQIAVNTRNTKGAVAQ